MTVSAGTMANPRLMGRCRGRRTPSFRGNSRAVAFVHARGNGAVRVRRSMVGPHPCDHVCRLANAGNFTGGCPVRRCYFHPSRVSDADVPSRRGLDVRSTIPRGMGRALVDRCGRPVRRRLRRATGGVNKRKKVSFVVSCHLMCYLHGKLPLSVSICSLTR